jgi:hypothetical protein
VSVAVSLDPDAVIAAAGDLRPSATRFPSVGVLPVPDPPLRTALASFDDALATLHAHLGRIADAMELLAMQARQVDASAAARAVAATTSRGPR